MRLENTVKYHSPKSQAFTDSSRATDSETLTGSDIMAALGMAQSAAPLGFSAFSGKMELSQRDKEKAIQLLTQFGMKHSGKVAALRKLDKKVRLKVVQTLAIFAFQDYCRSAASTIKCNCCKGKGLIDTEIFTMKSHYKMRLPDWAKALGQSPSDFEVKRQVKEKNKILCENCKGKGVISNACRCKGRGKVLDKEQTEIKGIPIYKDCSKCSGRGFSKISFSKIVSHPLFLGSSKSLIYSSIKPLYEKILEECYIGESAADNQLSKYIR